MFYSILICRVLPFCTGFVLAVSLMSVLGLFGAVGTFVSGETPAVPPVKEVPYYSGKYKCSSGYKTKSYHRKEVYKRYDGENAVTKGAVPEHSPR